METLKILVSITSLSGLLCVADGFIVNVTCPNSRQCLCTGWSKEVNCESRHLEVVPTFLPTSDLNRLRLENNNISYIGSRAFASFKCNGGSLALQMSHNRILMLSDQAFDGLESCRLSIDISFNHLTDLPNAFRGVRHLLSLNVKGNPLIRLDPSTMATIGLTVSEFRVDIGRLQKWPIELNYLLTVEKLELSGIPFYEIDQSSFTGFDKLQELNLVETKLKVIPTALCSLTNVTSVNISSNHHLIDISYDMFDVCDRVNLTDSKVKHVFFDDNRVNLFPNVMKMFPNVEKLGNRANDMYLMDGDELTPSLSLRSLSLGRNTFTRVPYAVNKFTELTYLDLSENKITTIEDFDLNGLAKLSVLDLDSNPLEYITTKAFTHTPGLTTLYLARTKLRRIPEAVTRLANLNYLTLNNGLVQCSCDMPYVKQWNFGRVYFRNATCIGLEKSIDQFLHDYEILC